MASNINATVSIPLNDRAVHVSKRMALNSSGVTRYSLDSIVQRQVNDATTKAAQTMDLNKQAQAVVDESAMGSAPTAEQAGRVNVLA
ncbi:MAG: hypothetical protein H7829_18315 [Magnetococcus sp. THC-1_WYH]